MTQNYHSTILSIRLTVFNAKHHPHSFLPYVCVCLFQFSRMMSEDSQDAFRNVNRKPGLQIWTINVSLEQISSHCKVLVTRLCFQVECVMLESYLCREMSWNWICFLIQKMKMVPVPAKGFGNFFEGDCYIVLYVSIMLAEATTLMQMWFMQAFTVHEEVWAFNLYLLLCF